MAIVDPVVRRAPQTRHLAQHLAAIEDLHHCRMLTHLDRVPDQPRRHRIRTAAHPDRAPLTYPALKRRVLGDRGRRQRPQVYPLLGQPHRRRPVPRPIDDRPQEGEIRRLIDEVGGAPQQQRLLDGGFRPEVGLLDNPVFVGLARLNPRRAQSVMLQYLPEPRSELPPATAPQLARRR